MDQKVLKYIMIFMHLIFTKKVSLKFCNFLCIFAAKCGCFFKQIALKLTDTMKIISTCYYWFGSI